jgi:phosphate starvation-inducible PhoH-like protein
MKFQPLFKSLAMFVLVHNIRPVFSFMGRNRKSLGGQWGESVMTTMMAEYNTGKHMKGNKKMKKPSTYHSSSDSDFYVTKPGQSQSHTPTKKRNEPLYKPKTVNQELYLRFLNDDNVKIVLGVGPAGCGKTLFACHRAIEELRSGNIEKIVVTRPMVAVEDESVGFLPGDMNQKMAPWTRPIFDIFGEYYDVDDLNEMVRKGVIEISPLAYMRGRTFKNSFIIADEMQNSTPNQMMMVTTRLGQDSKMVITGDLNQSDRGLSNNGLLDFMHKLRRFSSVFEADVEVPEEKTDLMFSHEPHAVYQVNKWENKKKLGIKLVQLENEDVCRSDIVSRVLELYNHGNTEKDYIGNGGSGSGVTGSFSKRRDFQRNRDYKAVVTDTETNDDIIAMKNAIFMGMDAPEYLLTREMTEMYHTGPVINSTEPLSYTNVTENFVEKVAETATAVEEKVSEKTHKYFTRNNAAMKSQDAAMIPRRDEEKFRNRCNMF